MLTQQDGVAILINENSVSVPIHLILWLPACVAKMNIFHGLFPINMVTFYEIIKNVHIKMTSGTPVSNFFSLHCMQHTHLPWK